MSKKTFGPYSPVRVSGEWLFVSGQVGIDPNTGVTEPGAKSQAVQVLTNLQNQLQNHGSGLEHVIKTTVFLKNMDDFAEVNGVYAQFFRDPYPARSCIEVARLPEVSADGTELLVEIEAVAFQEMSK